MTTVRAKFRCNTVELATREPVEVERYSGGGERSTVRTWPRTYRFSAVYASEIPEDQRYAQATPWADLTMRVDNPDVSFEPGQNYYLDFTLVPA
jgi:hypothetical protein